MREKKTSKSIKFDKKFTLSSANMPQFTGWYVAAESLPMDKFEMFYANFPKTKLILSDILKPCELLLGQNTTSDFLKPPDLSACTS